MSVESAGSTPLAIAHRGDSAHYPENTSVAFTAALRHPVAGIELDLRPTADGGVVVCHDASLRRFGGSGRLLARCMRSNLADEDIGGWFAPRFRGERLLDLAGLLKNFARRTTLLLELKPAIIGAALNRRFCQAVVAGIQEAHAVEQVMVLCFDQRQLDRVHHLEPRLRCVRNRERLPRSPARFVRKHPYLHALCVDQRDLAGAAATVAAYQALGLRVFTYTCNTAAAIARARAAGVDAILADDPAWLVRQLGRRRR